jgi:uncharacterized repeat protein (TIGR02543 family)
LCQPGKPDRSKDVAGPVLPLDFLERVVTGKRLALTLPDGQEVRGEVRRLERDGDGILFVEANIKEPAPGFCYLQRQTIEGFAGPMVGHVRFDGKNRAWKIEPTADLKSARFVDRVIDEVLCVNYEKKPEAMVPAPGDIMAAPQNHPIDIPIPTYQDVIPLQSLPGAEGVLYLDFDGEVGPFAGWASGSYFLALPSGATNAQVFEVWKMVSEDYQGFNLNVTTDRKVFDAAVPGHRQQIIITTTDTAWPGVAGVAQVGTFNNSTNVPCWSFCTTGLDAAATCAHELGHTLGLGHKGCTDPFTGYYEGHGSGVTSWGPIMGSSYSNLIQWSKGEYLNADSTQDELATITTNNNGVAYRTDDCGDTLATARYLDVLSGGSVSNEGILERTGDVDAFRFSTSKSGRTTLTIKPVDLQPNLDIYAEIVNASTLAVVFSNNPNLDIKASFSNVTLQAGEYLLRVRGTGRGDPLVDGYTNYGCIGTYFITGTVANAVVADRFSIAENLSNGTAVGIVAARGSHGTNPLTWSIASGNTNGAFAINAATGAITVANSTAINYEALSSRWDDPAEFELFVTITDSLNSSLNESIRTVVTVTNVNEAPVISGGSVTMLESSVGTYVGTVTASDPDRFDFPTMSIVSGNTGGVFSIDPATGVIRIAAETQLTQSTDYTLSIRAVDQGSPALSSTVTYTVHLVKYVPVYSIRGDGKVLATFSAAGNATWTVPADATNMEVLVVGGGGGANYHGSGAGAGGLYATTFAAGNMPSGTVAITVGAGGAGSYTSGANGRLSRLGSIIAYGGQGINGSQPTDGINQDGQLANHGGNQGGYSINGGAAVIPGHPGGGSFAAFSGGFDSGGGAGAAGTHNNGEPGGVGVQDDITGTNTYYAGGGGATCDGPGGSGGGGKGGQTLPSQDGTANTGGGAGGGYLESARGASGGSGVVIVAYNSPSSIRTVSFNSNGGSAVSSQNVLLNGTATAPTAPTRNGYTFSGWYTDNNTFATAFNFSTAITANTTLYAKWTIGSYTLTYSADANGIITGTTPQTVTYLGSGTAVTAKPNSGYQFSKWSDNLTANPRTDSNVVANISVTASFVPVFVPTTVSTRSDGKTVATFSTVGSGAWIIPAGVTSMEVLVVGGGGSSGGRYSSGAGAGGLYYTGSYAVTPGSGLTVTVGAGGAAVANNVHGNNGSQSVFGNLIAYGGERTLYNGYNVGGAQGGYSTDGGSTIISGKPGWSGGTGVFASGSGAGASGTRGNSQPGGIGVRSSITGTATYYAGGGGACVGGLGGDGGGGDGKQNGITGDPVSSGHANTGGGAGGAAGSGSGAGGSGVVIVAYQANPYAGWAGASGYQLSGGPADDDDSDGLTNYQEFAFGLDPTKGTSSSPVRHLGGAHFSYTRYADSGLTYTVWTSTNLKDWTGPAAVTSSVGAADGKGVVTVDVTLTSPPAGDKVFLRVKAQ